MVATTCSEITDITVSILSGDRFRLSLEKSPFVRQKKTLFSDNLIRQKPEYGLLYVRASVPKEKVGLPDACGESHSIRSVKLQEIKAGDAGCSQPNFRLLSSTEIDH